jgi:hypothetical protein
MLPRCFVEGAVAADALLSVTLLGCAKWAIDRGAPVGWAIGWTGEANFVEIVFLINGSRPLFYFP